MGTEAQIRFGRQDLVRLAIARLQDQLAAELGIAEAADVAAEARFRATVSQWVLIEEEGLLDEAACSSTHLGGMQVATLFELYDDQMTPPDTITVTISDGPNADFNFYLRRKVRVRDGIAYDLDAWIAARRAVIAAREADGRARALDGAARVAVIEQALQSTPEGAAVLEAVGKMAKVVVLEVDGG